jgi:type I restriction enzyme R subunit
MSHSHKITEQQIEDMSLEWLGALGWKHVYGPAIEPEKPDSERAEFSVVYLEKRLRRALRILNPTLAPDVLDEAFRIVTRPESPDLLTNNRAFQRMLTDGVKVPYRDSQGVEATADVAIVDWENPTRNDLLAVNQFTVTEKKFLPGADTPASQHNRRPDIVLFVNGLPLVVIELKNAADAKATVEAAFNQIQTYKAQITNLFTYNAVCVISDGLDARIGTISSDWERFMPWRALDNVIEDKGDLKTMLRGAFEPNRFLQLVRHFLVFEDTRGGPIKKVAGYHQFHAVNTALTATIEASRQGATGRAGVVWHTQAAAKA